MICYPFLSKIFRSTFQGLSDRFSELFQWRKQSNTQISCYSIKIFYLLFKDHLYIGDKCLRLEQNRRFLSSLWFFSIELHQTTQTLPCPCFFAVVFCLGNKLHCEMIMFTRTKADSIGWINLRESQRINRKEEYLHEDHFVFHHRSNRIQTLNASWKSSRWFLMKKKTMREKVDLFRRINLRVERACDLRWVLCELLFRKM